MAAGAARRRKRALASPPPGGSVGAAAPALLATLFALAAGAAAVAASDVLQDPAAPPNPAAQLAGAHFAQHGMRLPTPAFTAALRAAAADISHLSCRKSLVLLAMANEDALNHTVPLFLYSLSRVRMQGGRQAGETLDARLVVVAWSRAALAMCRALHAKGYRHQCVRDAEHAARGGSFSFHSVGFNALGFAKIKYILNGLSAGHDVVFLDTDIVVLRDPLPHLLSRGAHMLGSMEKCLIVNASVAFHSPEYRALRKRPPHLNIGVLYFRASAGVTRCVYNWAWDMWSEVAVRPRVWDQDLYGKIMSRCAGEHFLNWKVLDPRTFQSGCFPQCGCTFGDGDVTPARVGRFSRGHRFVRGGLCAPHHWGDWFLRHYPCTGLAEEKGTFMQGLLDGFYGNTTARIAMRREGRRRRR